MLEVAIRAINLSKRYRIGIQNERNDTFAGVLTSFIRSPVKNMKRLRNLSRFNEGGEDTEDVIWALRGVSFNVKMGEVVGVIGRNGAGKSTLLKIISRITFPTSGKVELRGRVSSLLEVGTGFHSELTGRENVFLNGTILGMTRKEINEKFDEIVDFSGVEKFIDTPVKRYSSGMRVRLAFSVAAHLEPEILLVDEVLAVGDISFQRKCLGKMEKVAEGGRTVLFVSHNMGMIRNLCQRAILLESGFLSGYGGVSPVIDQYLDGLQEKSTNGEIYFSDTDHRNNKWAIETVILRKVRAVQDGEIISGVVRAEEPLDIEIYYDLREDVVPFRVKLRLFSQEGVEMLHTDDTISDQTRERRSKGRYVSICQIPAYLLNTKSYKIEVGIDSPKVRNLIPFTQVLDFYVTDTSGQTKFQNYPGIIHPRMKWECRN